jgi:dephospho-CoA kinase
VKFIGLTGGIGTGKSTVGAALAARGALVTDVDRISRELQEPGQPFYEAIVARWGPGIVKTDGSLDRPELARIAFSDKKRLRELTMMAAPFTEQEVVRRASEHLGTDRIVVNESAMYSAPMYGMTGLVVVDAPVEIAVARLVGQRHMDEDDARARIAAQSPREIRLQAAGFIIDNGGDAEALQPQIDTLLEWAHAQPDATPTVKRS